ncbi:MAG: glycosyltransferase involved in cell wall biosynthesis [Algoriphagus sp.]|jgi:glycosyltransferase involved in cell wall biosynthesis
MKKLKVAFVSSYPPGKRSLNEYGFYLINHFREKSLDIEEVLLISDKLPKGKTYNFGDFPVPIKETQVWDFNKWTNPLAILKALKNCKPDVVVFNIQFLSFGDKKIPAALGLLTPWLSTLAGIPSVVLLHNILEQVDLNEAGITKNKLLIKIFNFIGTVLTRIILKADLLAVTIPKYVQILEEKYKAKNVTLIPHGSFEVPPAPDYKLPEGPLQVMAFGKFGTYKKVESMIEAVELIRSRTNLDMEIVVAGTDSPNTPGYLASVKESHKHVSQLRFTGYVEEGDVPRIFGDSAVCVFPYTSTTGSSGVLHQAGSYGKAAVMPNLGDLAILVKEEGYAGAFFELDSVESLADAIQKVLEDEGYRNQLSKQNYYAAASLPMGDLVNWYILHFRKLLDA